MVDISDIVVTFVKRNYGGAVKFKEYAEKKNKTVINIADKKNNPLYFYKPT